MLNYLFRCFVFGAMLVLVCPAYAQTQKLQDLSSMHVDDMTDAQVRAFMKQVESSGLGEGQLEQVAIARGMDAREIEKLRLRVEKLKKQSTPSSVKQQPGRKVNKVPGEEENPISEQNTTKSGITPREEELRNKIFGASLFANTNLTFEPNLRLATPPDYELGPDDQILIDIYGYSEASYQLTVSPEGTINIPMVGVVPVSGATMEQASARIRSRLSKIYNGIGNGTTSVSISLGNIRSIRVVLTGELMKPGTYTLPSVATVFNALYASGGPSLNGSFRVIQIVRGGTVVAALDVYDFLLYGSLKNNIRLQDQDVIRVPTYRTRVEISGEVKRPGVYEMVNGESLKDLISFAGDFNERAYRARIKVLKNTETERKIEDITAGNYDDYKPATGDQYFVEPILDRFENRVQINGAVFRPGAFELTEGMTLSQLIKKAEGLKEDAFPNRGYITRIKNNLTTELISFSPVDIISGKEADIPLRREDVISIPSIFDLKEEYVLTIDGEVRKPGTFPYSENTNLEELIIKAGGLREGATARRVEISRRVTHANPLSDSTATAQVFYVEIDRSLKQASEFILKPFDIVSVRPAPGYQIQKVVRIEGEVLYPGLYTITNKNERISDLIKRAGGLTSFAYEEGASLKRPGRKVFQSDIEREQNKLQQFESLQKATNDSAEVNLSDIGTRNDFVGIDLPQILKRPHKTSDLILEDGDIVSIPKELQTVRVSGEVLSPTSILFSANKSFRKCIRASGGFSPKAMKRHSYIVYANGSVASTKRFLFFSNYPKVQPGAEIFVPVKEERKNRLSTSEIVAITTGLATIATLIFTVLR